MTRRVLPAVLLALVLLPACGGSRVAGGGDTDSRVAALERRLATTCACHPRDIEGLPIQSRIRADLRKWIEEGKDDREILWLGFTRYGSALLAAGIADLEGEVRRAGWVTALIALLAFAALIANLRREGGGAGPPGGRARPGA